MAAVTNQQVSIVSQLIRHGKELAKRSFESIAAALGPQTRNAGPRLWVLMYHRILPANDPRFATEEPGMIVTPETFRQQLRQLKTLFKIMHLSEWIGRVERGEPLPSRACAITFDDGWRDNFEFALPILQQEQAPATVFVVSDMIGTHQQFWPNRLSRLLSHCGHKLPASLRALPALEQTSSDNRETLAAVIHGCKELSDEALLDLLTRAEQEAGMREPEQADLMSWDQVRALCASGLVEIGSHTCRHRRLKTGVTTEVITHEVTKSRDRIAAEIDQPVTLFCYPNGDVCAEADRQVREIYRAAVTTRHGINHASTDRHSLMRIGIHEDIGNTPTRFAARLSGWL
jgi:peptidoglycan/xylan/chitin deacetylase (PgdA/CDA1 family)